MAKIIIVGGGTAGWLTASYLASRLQIISNDQLNITLIESSDIPPIGVGEATTPTIRGTLAVIGITEAEFLKKCDATFKHGIKFVGWNPVSPDNQEHYYFHPFERPLSAAGDNLAGHWVDDLDPYKRNFADAVSIQNIVSSHNLAPKKATDPGYSGPMPYAYHLDAGKLALLLKARALKLGVNHVVSSVESVSLHENGDVERVSLSNGQEIAADIFVDCSGFLALLIEKELKEPFIDVSDILFCDRAVACQVPCPDTKVEIKPYTTATAQSAGWIWDVGLTNRRGTGHVYASRYQSQDEAEALLRSYIGPDAEALTFRHLKMRIGYRERQWRSNCIAIGLSSGFVEPLESTGIHLIEQSVALLSELLPRFLRGDGVQKDAPRQQYNLHMKHHYESIIDFIKFHYFLSKRRDSAFWRDNAMPETCKADMLEKMQAWEIGCPSVYDFSALHSTFDHTSYQYVMFGLGHRPHSKFSYAGAQKQRAIEIFKNVHVAVSRAFDVLPEHRQCLETITANQS